MYKISFAFGIASFGVVSADACARTLNLIRVIIFMLLLSQILAKIIDYMDFVDLSFVHSVNLHSLSILSRFAYIPPTPGTERTHLLRGNTYLFPNAFSPKSHPQNHAYRSD